MDGVRDYATAADAFAHALHLAPNDPRTLSDLGELKLQQGNWDEALELMQKATGLNPRDSALLSTIADVRYAQGRFAEARSLLLRALEIDPQTSSLRAEVALTYLAEGDIAHAETELSSLRLAAADYSLVVAFSQLARQKQATTAAIADFERTLAAAQDLDVIEIAVAQFELGHLNLCAGRTVQARTAFQTVATTLESARKNHHVDPFLPMYLGTAYAVLGKSDAAIELAQEGLSLAASDPERRPTALTFLAETQMFNGDAAAAVETLQELLRGTGSFFIPLTPSLAQLRQDCLWNPLRRNAGFQSLLAQQASPLNRPKP